MDTFLRSFSVCFLALFLVWIPVAVSVAAVETFPLSPGSSWTYRDLDGNLETLAIARVMEKKSVPLIEASYGGNRAFYYINGSEGIFRLQPAAGSDIRNLRGDLTLLLQWPLDLGQTWFSPWTTPQLSFTVLDRGPVKVAAGEFRDTVKIGYRPLSSPIYQGYIWFQPGVGVIAQEESGYRTELVSYSLSDLLVPVTVTVSGDKLFGLFRSTDEDSNAAVPGGFWPRIKNMTLSGPFYLFLFLFLIGTVSLFAYLNVKKVEMDLENELEVQEGETALASAMVREGLYEDAARILQRITARHPQWPDIATLLGRAYRETGRLSEACLELKRALTLNPHLVRARLELVRTYLLMSEPARALEEVETVLTEHQDFADAICLKGEILASMGLDQEALKCFREALEINPTFTEAQNALEQILTEEE